MARKPFVPLVLVALLSVGGDAILRGTFPDSPWRGLLAVAIAAGIALAASAVVPSLAPRGAAERAARGPGEAESREGTAPRGNDPVDPAAAGLLVLPREARSACETVHDSALFLEKASVEITAAVAEIADVSRRVEVGAERQARRIESSCSLAREVEQTTRDLVALAEELRARGGAAEEGSTLRAAIDAASGSATRLRIGTLEGARLAKELLSSARPLRLLAINAAIEAARESGGAETAALSEGADQAAGCIDGLALDLSRLLETLDRDAALAESRLRELRDASGPTESAAGLSASIHAAALAQASAVERLVDALDRTREAAADHASGTEEASRASRERTRIAQGMAATAHTLARSSFQLHDLIADLESG